MAVLPSGPVPATIMLVGEAPGEQEEREGTPFVGASGQELNRMLAEVGIMRSECFITNVCRVRPRDNDIGNFVALRKKDVTSLHVPLRDKMVLPLVVEGYNLLLKEISLVNPKVIIAFGNLAMWALTEKWGVTKWRGSILSLGEGKGPPVIPTYHPAAILRQWDWRAVALNDLRRGKRFADGRGASIPNWHFVLSPNFHQVMEVLDGLLRKVQLSLLWIDFDLETRAGHIACAGLSWSRTEAICIPFMCQESKDGYWNEEEEAIILQKLYQVLTHENVRVRWQNGLYDAQYTYRWWHFVPKGAQDTMISQHIAFAGLPKSLAFQASMYCEYHIYWKEDGKTWQTGMGEKQLWSYNCVDCVRTREVGEVEASVIKGYGLEGPEAFHQKLFWAVLRTMNRGIRLDQKAKSELVMEIMQERSKREQFFLDVLGHPLNPSSNPQMLKLFYEDLQQTHIMSRPKRGSPSHLTCDDEALELLKAREPILRPLIRNISEWRSLGVFLSTFLKVGKAGKRLEDTDGRVRCSFNICGTETYRFSSSESAFNSGTNLQNIPKGGEEDDSDLKLPNIRKIFIPDLGYTFFDTDLSKADLRVVVWESDETEMKAMLAEGRDPYVETAREFYRDPTITKLLTSGEEHPIYKTFKSFSHGTHYLGTAKGLAKRLALTVHEAERTQKWYFGKYPKIQNWHNDLKNQLLKRHFVENKFGYRRHYFDRIDDDIFRQGAAWIPQSTIGILIDHLYLAIHEKEPMIEVLLQVHDSLAGQFPSHQKDFCIRRLKEEAQITIPYDDPLVIPVGVKVSDSSWGDCS